MDEIYAFLKSNGYSFRKLEKLKAVKFSSYDKAFEAAFNISNSSLNITVGQDNKMLYFSDGLVEKDYVEAGDNDPITYEGLVMSFSMYLDWILNINIEKKISKNKSFMIGDADRLHEEFVSKYPNSLNIVTLEKKRDGLLIKPKI